MGRRRPSASRTSRRSSSATSSSSSSRRRASRCVSTRASVSARAVEERREMLARIGGGDVDELVGAIPKDARHPKLGIPAGLSEIELTRHLEALAAKDRPAGTGPFFLGGPVQRRYIPAAV